MFILCSEFRVVMSVAISPYNRYCACLYLQLFVGELMSYLRYLCLFAYSDVQHIMCCVFLRLVCPMLHISLAPLVFSNVCYTHKQNT